MREPNFDYNLENRTFPANAIIEVCNFCNLKCGMCPYPTLKRPAGMMEENLFKRIIDQIAEIDKTTTIWPAQMGEPLMLGQYLFALINYTKDKGLPVVLNTNGILIEDNLENILESQLDEVIVGIDGATKGTYEKIRVGGDFDRIVRNVNLLLEKKPESLKVAVQFVETDENEKEEDTFKEYWLGQGAIVKFRRKLGWGSTVSSQLKKMKTERLPCPWLLRTIVVHWDGSVVQCGGDNEGNFSVGNVEDKTLYELWSGPLHERRDRHLNNDFNFEPCRTCFDWACGISEWHYPTGAGA